MYTIVKKDILGVDVSQAVEREVLEYIVHSIEKKSDPYYIVTPNPEIVVYATRHKSFQSVLNQARISLCDGVGLKVAANFLGTDIPQKITGVDLLEKLCSNVAKKPITIGFLGGRAGIAELTAECLQSRYPELQVVYASSEWGEDGFDSVKKIVRDKDTRIQRDEKKEAPNIQISQYPPIDILFVAFGFPKQELWMHEHVGKIPVRVMMGVGGAFDYLAGKVPRAPGFVRAVGMEWLFRLMVQPWRIRRQLALIEFIFLVLKAKLIKPVS